MLPRPPRRWVHSASTPLSHRRYSCRPVPRAWLSGCSPTDTRAAAGSGPCVRRRCRGPEGLPAPVRRPRRPPQREPIRRSAATCFLSCTDRVSCSGASPTRKSRPETRQAGRLRSSTRGRRPASAAPGPRLHPHSGPVRRGEIGPWPSSPNSRAARP